MMDISLLNDELSTQVKAYRCNKFSEDIVSHFSQHTILDNDSVNDNFNSIITAKNEWEVSVDSLERQAIVILDCNLNIIRTNKTIKILLGNQEITFQVKYFDLIITQ